MESTLPLRHLLTSKFLLGQEPTDTGSGIFGGMSVCSAAARNGVLQTFVVDPDSVSGSVSHSLIGYNPNRTSVRSYESRVLPGKKTAGYSESHRTFQIFFPLVHSAMGIPILVIWPYCSERPGILAYKYLVAPARTCWSDFTPPHFYYRQHLPVIDISPGINTSSNRISTVSIQYIVLIAWLYQPYS